MKIYPGALHPWASARMAVNAPGVMHRPVAHRGGEILAQQRRADRPAAGAKPRAHIRVAEIRGAGGERGQALGSQDLF